MTTESELRAVARRYHRHREALEADQSALRDLILRARGEGVTLRRLADLTGLTFGRIHQIEKEAAGG